MCLPLAALFTLLAYILCVAVGLYILRLFINFAVGRWPTFLAADIVDLVMKIITALIWLMIALMILSIIGNIFICLIGNGGPSMLHLGR